MTKYGLSTSITKDCRNVDTLVVSIGFLAVVANTFLNCLFSGCVLVYDSHKQAHSLMYILAYLKDDLAMSIYMTVDYTVTYHVLLCRHCFITVYLYYLGLINI